MELPTVQKGERKLVRSLRLLKNKSTDKLRAMTLSHDCFSIVTADPP